MKKQFTVKNIVLAAFFIALGFVLPFLTMQIPSIGSMLLPMHIPVIIAGFVCGGPIGAVVGFIVPLLRSALLGMPPMFPTAIAMAFELATYGLVAGLAYQWLPKKPVYIFVSLILSMLVGRVVWGVVTAILMGVSGNAFGMAAFVAGAFTNAIPGIILQLVLIPIIVISLQKTRRI